MPVIGVPGYPVSAAMTAEILVKPLINIWLGLTNVKQEEIQAILTRKITSTAGDDDYVRVILGNVNGKLLAAPISRGAGVTTSLSKADGILVIPRMIQGIEAGASVSVRPYRDLSEINKNYLTIGSHDMTLDILAQFLSKYNRRLVSSNAGSMGGLLALKKGENHFAGSHLLDPQTGTYNTIDIKRLFTEPTDSGPQLGGTRTGADGSAGESKKYQDPRRYEPGGCTLYQQAEGCWYAGFAGLSA